MTNKVAPFDEENQQTPSRGRKFSSNIITDYKQSRSFLLTFRKFCRRQVSIRNLVILFFVLFNVASAFLSGYFALRYGQDSVKEISLELRSEYSNRIRENVQSFLNRPFEDLRETQLFLTVSTFNVSDPVFPDILLSHLWAQFTFGSGDWFYRVSGHYSYSFATFTGSIIGYTESTLVVNWLGQPRPAHISGYNYSPINGKVNWSDPTWAIPMSAIQMPVFEEAAAMVRPFTDWSYRVVLLVIQASTSTAFCQRCLSLHSNR